MRRRQDRHARANLAARRTNTIDITGEVVRDEQTALRSDRDAGGATDARIVVRVVLEAGQEVVPLRRRIAPVDGRDGIVAVHRDEGDVRRNMVAVDHMPTTVRGNEQAAAVGTRKCIRSALRIRIERRADQRGIGWKFDPAG